MLSVNISEQGVCFLCSVISGLTLGAFYTILKLLREAFGNRKASTIIFDLVFMLAFTIVTFIFSTGYTEGFVRYSVVIGEVSGIILFKITLGKLLHSLFVYILVILRKALSFARKNITKFTEKVLKARRDMLYNKENKRSKNNISRKGKRKHEA